MLLELSFAKNVKEKRNVVIIVSIPTAVLLLCMALAILYLYNRLGRTDHCEFITFTHSLLMLYSA